MEIYPNVIIWEFDPSFDELEAKEFQVVHCPNCENAFYIRNKFIIPGNHVHCMNCDCPVYFQMD
jgi:hypothetical protein